MCLPAMNSKKAAQFLQYFQVKVLLYGQLNYVPKRQFMYVKMLHKRFINFVNGAKENLQKAPGLRWIFVEFCHVRI